MHVIEIFLPLVDNEGHAFTPRHFDEVRQVLTERWGGVTAFTRAPAEGVWKKKDGDISRDQIVIFEVMVDELDHHWWRQYQHQLRRTFKQEDLLIRAVASERI